MNGNGISVAMIQIEVFTKESPKICMNTETGAKKNPA
jgi:hypothetical protein